MRRQYYTFNASGENLWLHSSFVVTRWKCSIASILASLTTTRCSVEGKIMSRIARVTATFANPRHLWVHHTIGLSLRLRVCKTTFFSPLFCGCNTCPPPASMTSWVCSYCSSTSRAWEKECRGASSREIYRVPLFGWFRHYVHACPFPIFPCPFCIR